MGGQNNQMAKSGDVRSMLTEMDAIVERLHLPEKEAYVEACRRNPGYAEADGLKLRFLRVENYNTGLAVHRLCQYFDFKFLWFGQQQLARPILLADLSTDDLAVLRRGDFKLMEQRDNERRRIAHYVSGSRLGDSETAMANHKYEVACRRALFYFLDTIALEDEEVQEHGITSIISTDWNQDTQRPLPFHRPNSTAVWRQLVDPEFLFDIGRYLAFAAPVKVAHVHFVHHQRSAALGDIAKWLSSITSRLHGRISFFSHQVVSHDDHRTQLLNHGIPIDAINIIDELCWEHKRKSSLLEGQTSTTRMGNPPGLSAGRPLITSAESRSPPSSVAGLSLLPSSEGSRFREDPIRQRHHDPRSSAMGAMHAPRGNSFFDPRSSLALDSMVSRRHDLYDSRHVTSSSALLAAAEEPETKKRKRSGPVTLPSTLYFDEDADHLSPYQCLLRQQIEAFEACSDDVQYNASRMNRGIVFSQVGLRCRHCADSPEWERANGAVYYPGRLDMLYQASQNMAKNHLCTTCQKIPARTRDLLSILRTDKKRATAGKEYWAQAAQRMGIYEEVESEDNKTSRLRFRETPANDK